MKNRFSLFYSIILLVLVFSCSSKEGTLIGKWKVDEMKLASGGGIAGEVYKEIIETSSFEFLDNKTFTAQMMGETQTGTWELSKDAKTLTTKAENTQIINYLVNTLEKDKLQITFQENNEEGYTLILIPFEN